MQALASTSTLHSYSGYADHDAKGTSTAYRASKSLLHECLCTPYTHYQLGSLQLCKVPPGMWKYPKISSFNLLFHIQYDDPSIILDIIPNTKKKWVATNQKGDPTQFWKQNADRIIDRQIIRLNDRHVCVDIYVHIHIHNLTQPPSIHNTATTPSPRFQQPAPLAGRHPNLLSDFKPEGRTNTILKIEYRPYPRWTNSSIKL